MLLYKYEYLCFHFDSYSYVIMCTYMYICIHIYTYIGIYVYIYIYIYNMRTQLVVRASARMQASMHVSMCRPLVVFRVIQGFLHFQVSLCTITVVPKGRKEAYGC